MDPEHENLLTKTMTVLNAVCFALVFSTLTYVLIAFFLLEQGQMTATLQDDRIATVVAGVGVLFLLLASPIQKLLDSKPAIGDPPADRCRRYQTAVIVGQAVRESAAVMGMTLTLLSGKLFWVVGLSLLSLLMMALNWPRRSQLESRLQEIPPIG